MKSTFFNLVVWPYANEKPATKAAVINKSKPGKMVRIVFCGKMGLPAFKKPNSIFC